MPDENLQSAIFFWIKQAIQQKTIKYQVSYVKLWRKQKTFNQIEHLKTKFEISKFEQTFPFYVFSTMLLLKIASLLYLSRSAVKKIGFNIAHQMQPQILAEIWIRNAFMLVDASKRST